MSNFDWKKQLKEKARKIAETSKNQVPYVPAMDFKKVRISENDPYLNFLKELVGFKTKKQCE